MIIKGEIKMKMEANDILLGYKGEFTKKEAECKFLQGLIRGGVIHENDIDITPITRMILYKSGKIFNQILACESKVRLKELENLAHIDAYLGKDENKNEPGLDYGMKFISVVSGISKDIAYIDELNRKAILISCEISIYDVSDNKDISHGDVFNYICDNLETYHIHQTYYYELDFINNPIPIYKDHMSWSERVNSIDLFFLHSLIHWSENYLKEVEKTDNANKLQWGHYDLVEWIELLKLITNTGSKIDWKLLALSSLNKLDAPEFLKTIKQSLEDKIKQGYNAYMLEPYDLSDIIDLIKDPKKFKDKQKEEYL